MSDAQTLLVRGQVPNLQAVMDDAEKRHPMFTPRARAELRALLAVARAARKDHNPGGEWCDAFTKTSECPGCRALARLDRATSPRSTVKSAGRTAR